MDREAKLVYVRGMLLQAEIRMQAMLVANKEREERGESLAYNEKDFLSLIDEFGVHHNSMVSELTSHY